jgi:MFS family permease
MGSALSASALMKYGKWKMIMVMNIFVVLGSILSIIDNMYVICIGKVLFGIAAGGFGVYCPNYLNEVVPIEWKGPSGTMSSLFLGLGNLIPMLFGLAIPESPYSSEEIDSFWI